MMQLDGVRLSHVRVLALIVASLCSCSAERVLFAGATQRETGVVIVSEMLKMDSSIDAVVLSRSPERAKKVYAERGHDVEVVPGSLSTMDDIAAAAKGVDAIWFLTPTPEYSNFTNELQCTEAVIEGAKMAGVKRVILGLSNGAVAGEDSWMGQGKAGVEQLLAGSDLSWVSIQTMLLADVQFLPVMDIMTFGFGFSFNPFCYPSDSVNHYTTITDVARASVRAIKNSALTGIFAVGDPTKYTHQALNDVVNSVAGAGARVSCLPLNVLGYWMKVLQYVKDYMDGKTASLIDLYLQIWDRSVLMDDTALQRGIAELLDGSPTTMEKWFRLQFGKEEPKKEEL